MGSSPHEAGMSGEPRGTDAGTRDDGTGVPVTARPRTAAGRLRAGRIAGAVIVAVLATVSLSACSVTDTVGRAFNGFGFPQGGVTQQSQRIYDLWIGSMIAALLVGLLVYGLIFWAIIRYRKRGEQLPAQTRYNMPIEMIYTVIPFLIISVLFFYTATTETYLDRLSKKPDVTVEVVASKWNWQFTYMDENAKGADGRQVSTVGATDYIPVLVVPTDRKVQFVERSQDVVHSFWIPELLFKRDVIPGNVTNRFEVTVEKEGAFVGHCAEFCGTYHAMMNFELRAVSPGDYDRFIDAKKSGMSTPQALESIGQPGLATTTQPFANVSSDSRTSG